MGCRFRGRGSAPLVGLAIGVVRLLCLLWLLLLVVTDYAAAHVHVIALLDVVRCKAEKRSAS
jgi:hypothetical protein